MLVFVIVAVLVIIVTMSAVWIASKSRLDALAKEGRELQAHQETERRPREFERRWTVLVTWSNVREQSKLERARVLLGMFVGKTHTWYLDDDDASGAGSWALFPNKFEAVLSVRIGADSEGEEMIEKLEGHGFHCQVYQVEYDVYTDYGEYAGPARTGWNPLARRTWPMGQRSPYHINFTAISSKRGMSRDRFIHKWRHYQSPMSEMIQPRARYTRSLVTRRKTLGAPIYDAFVVEAWPTARHVTNPFWFFHAVSLWELVLNITVMIRSAVSFSDLSKIHGSVMSEYIFEAIPPQPE
mmetsp:Transcript_8976/g.16568  ORF Transcript_8976/g.16568 Transcript_8976/m.16568 type:complete len:297 (-) Transcript_8976:455-1345(-)